MSESLPAPSRRRIHAAIAVAVVVGSALRFFALDCEIGHDEAYSWLVYASVSYADVFTTYDLPNNHILHSALMRLASQAFAGQSEWMLRTPALLAGVAAIPVTAGLAMAALGSPVAGAVAAWCLALHPSHIAYSQSARGYSMLVLFAAVSLWAALIAIRGGRVMWVVFAGAAWLATWTLPSAALFLLSAGSSCVVLTWRRDGISGVAAPLLATAGAGLASAAAYWPVFDDLLNASRVWGVQVWADPSAALSAVAAGVGLLVGPGPLALLILSGAVLLFRRSHPFAVHVAVALAIPTTAALVTGVAGQGRSYIYLLPMAIVLASAWVVEVDRRIRVSGTVLLTVVLAAGAWSVLRGTTEHGWPARLWRRRCQLAYPDG